MNDDPILAEVRKANRLLAALITKDATGTSDRFVLLSTMGFTPEEISELTGAPQRTVSVTLSNIRRQQKAKRRKPTVAQEAR